VKSAAVATPQEALVSTEGDDCSIRGVRRASFYRLHSI